MVHMRSDGGIKTEAATYRWNILTKEIPKLTVKPLSYNRWDSRIDAIKTLM